MVVPLYLAYVFLRSNQHLLEKSMPKILIAGLIESHTVSASGSKVGASVIEIHGSDMALYFIALNHISILLIFWN